MREDTRAIKAERDRLRKAIQEALAVLREEEVSALMEGIRMGRILRAVINKPENTSE